MLSREANSRTPLFHFEKIVEKHGGVPIQLKLLFIIKLILTEKSLKGSYANSVDPDQMPHDVASDQGLH